MHTASNLKTKISTHGQPEHPQNKSQPACKVTVINPTPTRIKTQSGPSRGQATKATSTHKHKRFQAISAVKCQQQLLQDDSWIELRVGVRRYCLRCPGSR